MTENQSTCPVCSDTENTYKVSQIIIQSLVRLIHGDKAIGPIIDRLQAEIPEERRDKSKGSRYYRQLMDALVPSQEESQITRAINPDWVAFAMVLLSIFFLYQIYTSQYLIFWYMVAVAVVGFAVYVIFHKKILAKYQNQKSQESGSFAKVEKAVGLWMKLYYCATDNVIFGARKDETIPIDQMHQYHLAFEKTKYN